MLYGGRPGFQRERGRQTRILESHLIWNMQVDWNLWIMKLSNLLRIATYSVLFFCSVIPLGYCFCKHDDWKCSPEEKHEALVPEPT
jgi:hypothetical protein